MHIAIASGSGQAVSLREGRVCGTQPLGKDSQALGVVINAVADALSDYGVKHIEMPATPERIWRAIQGLPAI